MFSGEAESPYNFHTKNIHISHSSFHVCYLEPRAKTQQLGSQKVVSADRRGEPAAHSTIAI
jgi:hypothetical protein